MSIAGHGRLSSCGRKKIMHAVWRTYLGRGAIDGEDEHKDYDKQNRSVRTEGGMRTGWSRFIKDLLVAQEGSSHAANYHINCNPKRDKETCLPICMNMSPVQSVI